MKPRNVLISIVILAVMAVPATAGFITPDDGGEDLFVHQGGAIPAGTLSLPANTDGETYGLVDCYVDQNGNLWMFWWDCYDCSLVVEVLNDDGLFTSTWSKDYIKTIRKLFPNTAT
jgi:hypothetical protein